LVYISVAKDGLKWLGDAVPLEWSHGDSAAETTVATGFLLFGESEHVSFCIFRLAVVWVGIVGSDVAIS